MSAETLRFLRSCAEARGDWAEARRITLELTRGKVEVERTPRRSSRRATLTRAAVLAIRRSHAEGESAASLARSFGTNVGNVYKIVHRQTWVDV